MAGGIKGFTAMWLKSSRFHVQTITGPYVNRSISGPFKPVSKSSHTQGARCAASALTILDTSRLLIAVPAFIELEPNGGKRQVRSFSQGLFLTEREAVVPVQVQWAHDHCVLTSCRHGGRVQSNTPPSYKEVAGVL